MKKILSIIRNYVCYCGIEKDEYNKVKRNAYVSNFEVWRILHLLMDAVFLFLFVSSLFNDLMGVNKWFYLGMLIYSLLTTLMCFLFKKKDSILGQLLIYLSISGLFLFGCFLTSNKPDLPGITFIALLLITPLFMIDKPYFMSLELIVASTVYLIWMSFVKESYVFKVDLANVIIFTIIGIITHIIVNSFRIKEFVLIRKINIQKDLDELTGLKNKAALTREITEYIEGSGHSKKGLFFVLDIDFFKQINDHYGHDIGDIILDELGKYFLEKFTNDEIVGRFGGDEFVIFIKDNDDADYAKKMALEISKEVAERIKLPNNNEQIGVSIGIAVYQGHETHYSDIFKKADEALYKAKANRQMIYSINK